MAEAKLAKDNNLSKLFYECKDYVVATCQGSFWSNKVDDICQVGSNETSIYISMKLFW